MPGTTDPMSYPKWLKYVTTVLAYLRSLCCQPYFVSLENVTLENQIS